MENSIVHPSAIGNVTVGSDALCAIVALAVDESRGIAGLSAGIYDRIKKKLSSDKARGIRVEVDESGKIVVYVSVFVYYGEKISEVVPEMQRNIKDAVEKMAQAEVIAVNVDIDGIKFQKE